MLNALVVYGLGMGGFLLAYHHGRVVVPGMEGNVFKSLGQGVVRGWAIVVAAIWGLSMGIPGAGYREWWENYTSEHSMLLWSLTTVPLTVLLWLLKSITLQVMKSPGHYMWWDEGHTPCLHKLSMKLPLLWYVIYWVWLLCTPTLPFLDCFLRVFILKTSVSEIFPLG